jgi:hypothetical protein
MLTKNLDAGILVSSKIINLIVLLMAAWLLAKATWWVTNPIDADVYVDKTAITQFDNSVKYIINRYPFGVIAEQKAAKAPAIAAQLKLTGIYLNTPKNSIAFFELNGKHLLLKIGDKIDSAVTLKSIDDNSVVITDESGETTIRMTTGGGSSAEVKNAPQNSNFYSNSYNNQQPPLSTTNNNSNSSNNNSDAQEKRRKLIEEYMHSSRQEKERPNGANESSGNTSDNTK